MRYSRPGGEELPSPFPRLLIVLDQEVEAACAYLLQQRRVAGNELRHAPREDDLWNAAGEVLRIHHHELKIPGVGVEEAVDTGSHGDSREELHGLDVDDGLKSLCVSQPGNCGEIESEPCFPGEDV